MTKNKKSIVCVGLFVVCTCITVKAFYLWRLYSSSLHNLYLHVFTIFDVLLLKYMRSKWVLELIKFLVWGIKEKWKCRDDRGKKNFTV